MTSVVFAQAPFTIVRPADGAHVKETVHVLIPKGSIPKDGYLGIFLGGKFLEATVPPLKGKYYDYSLDTKGLGLADTEPGKPLKLELVLYVDYEKTSRIQDRTSVDLNIGNQANIPIPNSGLKLRYTFVPGTRMIYRLDQKLSISSVSEQQNSLGARPAEFTQDGETIRLAYEVMNSYGDGDGLLRIQPLPEKGKDYALLTAEGDQNQKKYMDYEMAPIYMRIKNTGQEVFGSLPMYTPLEGSVGGSSVTTDLFAPFPLPTLPGKAVRVGDSWQSQFQEGVPMDANNPYELSTWVESFPARGEFVNTEWEGNRPCAKIRHIIEAGTTTNSGKKLKAAGAQFDDDKISLQETIWFDLDSHKILKIVRDETIERKVTGAAAGGFPGAGGMGPGVGAGGKGGGISAGGMGGGMGAGASGDRMSPVLNNMQKNRRGGGGAGIGGPGGFGGPPGGMGNPRNGAFGGPPGFPGMGGNFGQGRTGAPQQVTSTFIRIRSLRTFTLEQ